MFMRGVRLGWAFKGWAREGEKKGMESLDEESTLDL